MSKARLLILGLASALTLASCKADDGGGAAADALGASGWWILDAEGFTLMGGGRTGYPESMGHLWTLEYAGEGGTLQLSAWEEGSRFADLVRQYPTVGRAEVDGYDVSLRQGPGVPSDGIPAAVMADWTDGDIFIGFGGGGLTEAQVRSYLEDLRPVTRSEWDAAVGEIPEPGAPPTVTSLGAQLPTTSSSVS